jgi:uncharacterized membrane protein
MEASVEARLHELEDRVRYLEGRLSPAPTYVPPSRPATPVTAEAPTPPSRTIEDLLGGRILGWLGGIAIVLGVVFFLALAIDRGWIDEPTRVALAFAGSTALLGLGLWLYERRGKTQAALAAVAAAVAALYASDTAATLLYHLVSIPVGLAVAGLVGVVATAIAVRWNSPIVAGVGIGGALLAPVLVGAGTGTASLAFMTIALAAAVGVTLWRRWGWLSALAFAASAPQLAAWLVDVRDDRLVGALAVLAGFWALYVVAALGYELRVPTASLRITSTALLLANAAAISGGGWALLHDAGHAAAATAWVLAVGAAYVALAGVLIRGRASRELPALLAAEGAALAAIGLALALDGPALVAGWAAEAALVSWAARQSSDRRGYVAAAVALTLATVHTLLFEVSPRALLHGVDSLPAAVVALALVAVAAASCAAATRGRIEAWRRVLEVFAGVVVVYLGSVALVDWASTTQRGQLLLSAFWGVVGLAALLAGLAGDRRQLRLGGLALLGLTVTKVYVFDLAALESVYRVGSFLALGLLLLAGAFAYQRVRALEAS